MGRWELSLYQTDIDDLIAFDAFTFAAANIASARIRGFEASGTVQVEDWTLGASLTLLDPENRSNGPDEGKRLPRRPEQMLQIDIDRQFERWSAGVSLYAAARSFDDLANRERLDAYALVGLRADYAFTPALRVQARLENALDADYETAFLYNQPGRAVYVTLRYEP
jgi:vitamin B12 transporter